MKYTIDYLSFTVPFATIAAHNAHLLGVVAETAVSDFLGDKINAILDGQPFEVLRGRAPYAASWGREDGGVRIFAAPQITHVLVECTGTGCETIRKHRQMENILAVVLQRVSRLDLAVDIVCDTPPHEFAAKRDVERFKAIGDIRSETGETYYVGSLKSDRFARVYRYREPHPRADTLRVEHVFRRDAAKVVARELLEVGVNSVVSGLSGVYGWTHEKWQPENVTPADLSVMRMKKETTATIRWLYGAVTSAIVKAVQRGELDIDDLEQHIAKAILEKREGKRKKGSN